MALIELNGKRVLVVGLGRSGVASALFLQSHGARVTVSDAKSEDQLREQIPTLLDAGIAVEHEDPFWDAPHSDNLPDFPQQRKDGFILARRFLGQYLPGRLV